MSKRQGRKNCKCNQRKCNCKFNCKLHIRKEGCGPGLFPAEFFRQCGALHGVLAAPFTGKFEWGRIPEKLTHLYSLPLAKLGGNSTRCENKRPIYPSSPPFWRSLNWFRLVGCYRCWTGAWREDNMHIRRVVSRKYCRGTWMSSRDETRVSDTPHMRRALTFGCSLYFVLAQIGRTVREI